MIPAGLEVRAELHVTSDTLAFGFSKPSVADGDSDTVWVDVFDYIGRMTSQSLPRFVVFDLRALEYLSAATAGHLTTLHRRLRRIRCELIVLISDPVVRGFFSGIKLDRQFCVATNEAELQALLQSRKPAPHAPEPEEFSREELTALETTGISLEDAIHTVERLRG